MEEYKTPTADPRATSRLGGAKGHQTGDITQGGQALTLAEIESLVASNAEAVVVIDRRRTMRALLRCALGTSGV